MTRFLSRYRRMSVPDLFATYAHALRVQFGGRDQMRGRGAAQTGLIVSLTTTPDRVHHIKPTLRSLLDQTRPAEKIILNYPEATRSGKAYPPVETLGLDPEVTVLRCKDEGPLTKVLPTLRSHPEAAIVVVDDDVIYPRDFLETLGSAWNDNPKCVHAYRGVRLEPDVPFSEQFHQLSTGIKDASLVDIVFGTWGYVLSAELLPPAIFDASDVPEEMKWVDDIVISGLLARAGVPRQVIPAKRFPVEGFVPRKLALNQTHNRDGRNERMAINWFQNDWGTENGSS